METKSNQFTPECIYRDDAHETKTRQEMEVSRTYLQVVLSEFLKLDIGVPRDLNMLLMRPETVFNKTLESLINTPETGSKFAMKKSAYMDTLALPDPAAFYAACQKAKKQMWCAVPEIWLIDGDKVVLNEPEAMHYIDSQSVYANTPEKVKLVKDLQKLCDLWNDLNKQLNGELVNPMDSFLNRWALNKFSIKQFSSGMAKIELDREAVKRWIA